MAPTAGANFCCRDATRPSQVFVLSHRSPSMTRPMSSWVIIAALVFLNGCQRGVSGKYLARFTNGIYWLQLVKTSDNHVAGQLETLLLDKDGTIERNAVAVTGAADGGNVTMSASLLDLQTLTLSGTLSGNKLTLTGGQPSPVVLTRSNLSDYEREVNVLNSQAKQILSTRAEAATRQQAEQTLATLVNTIEQIVGRMRQFDTEADLHLSRFPAAEDRYGEITAKVTQYVNRERQLGEVQNAAVARGQLGVAANLASLATDQLHNEVQSLQSSFEATIQSIESEAANAEAACRDVSQSGDLTPAQAEARKAACSSLFSADGPYRQKSDAMARAFVELEQVYGKERKTQDELLQQSAQRLQ
jgi:hypothetical protein